MWFKKSYNNDAMGSFESMDMYDDFKKFYDREHHEHPDDAKGLAMFEHGSHYFHYRSHYHLAFFMEHGCSSCEKPSHAIKFWYGDEEFAAHISESSSRK